MLQDFLRGCIERKFHSVHPSNHSSIEITFGMCYGGTLTYFSCPIEIVTFLQQQRSGWMLVLTSCHTYHLGGRKSSS